MNRLRTELDWEGRFPLLPQANRKNPDGSDAEKSLPPAGMAQLAKVADGTGPARDAILSGKAQVDRKVTDFIKSAHAAKRVVLPHTLRADDLPEFAGSMDDALEALFTKARTARLLADFPDVVVKWLGTQEKH